VIRFGGVVFQSPRGRARVRGGLWFNSVYFLALGVWAVIGSWDQNRVLGLLAGVVYLELTLSMFRASTLVGGVVYREDLAERIAPLLEDLCKKAACTVPKVVIRDDAVRVALVRRARGQLLLVLSAPYVQRVDDRQLGAILAHEVVHIARDDLGWAQIRLWASMFFALVGAIAVGAAAGGYHEVVLPVYLAAGFVALIVANAALSTFNRRLERRADLEGAVLCNDPAALASALGVARAFSDEARRRLYGPRPWRWILFPVSWRLPSHPPMSERIRRLHDLAPIGSSVDGQPAAGPLPGVAQ
jgi:heat shock protein HtpX